MSLEINAEAGRNGIVGAKPFLEAIFDELGKLRQGKIVFRRQRDDARLRSVRAPRNDNAGTMVHRVPCRQHVPGLVDEEGGTVAQAPDDGRILR